MDTIKADPILTLSCGRRIFAASEDGTVVTGMTKMGDPRLADYRAGSVLLADGEGRTITGPIDYRAALAYAEEIACGNARALTEPGGMLVLATAFLALDAACAAPEPGPETPAAAMEA